MITANELRNMIKERSGGAKMMDILPDIVETLIERKEEIPDDLGEQILQLAKEVGLSVLEYAIVLDESSRRVRVKYFIYQKA